MARRKKKERQPLSKPYVFRLPLAVAEKYEMLANEMGWKMSDMLRKVLCEQKHFVLKKEDRMSTLQIIRLMSKSSNNINQIAHHLNSLNFQGKLEYDEFIHYLRILDTIEAQNHLLLASQKKDNEFKVEKIKIN